MTPRVELTREQQRFVNQPSTFRGLYICKLTQLQHKTALLRRKDKQLLAQFDSFDTGLYAFNWHPFNDEDFLIND